MKAFWLALAFLLLLLHVSAQATDMKVTIKKADENSARIWDIVRGVRNVINSPEFKARILSAKFQDTKDSNQKIYETLTPAVWDLEYEWKMQKNWKGKCPVLGWTYPSVKTVWFNSCNFHGRKDSGIAGTIAHEQAHKLGYSHRSAKSYNSVPYAVGTIVAELFKPGLPVYR